MKISKKHILIGISIAFISMMLIFFISEGALVYGKFHKLDPISIQKEIKKSKEVAKKNKNPNDCLYSGCGNFY